MGRTVGSHNKAKQDPIAQYTTLTREERIKILAELIMQRIDEDRADGRSLLATLRGNQ